MISQESMSLRARIGHLRAIRAAEDDPALIEALRAFKASRLGDKIREGLAGEPELTAKQRRDLARLLA